MKRYNLEGDDVWAEEAEDGEWVKYEEAAEYAKAAMNTAVEASKLVMENELLKRQVKEQEEELQDQGMIIKAALETIETYRLLGTDDANVQDQREGK